MPFDVGAQLAEQQDGEGRGADPVGVVVAVHADAAARLDRGDDRLDRLAHVTERERIVPRQRPFEEAARLLDVGEAPVRCRGEQVHYHGIVPDELPAPDANYCSGNDYVVEFLGYRFSFNEIDFEGRVVAAAVKLGVVSQPQLDADETADLLALASQG